MGILGAIVRASQKAKPKKTTTVYHGSDADLTQDTIATQNKSGSDFGEGIYWASDIDEATNYGKNLYKADVSFKNPLILENRYQINGIFDELIGLKEQGKVSKDVYMKEYLQSLGYDGLIVKNPIMGENTSKPWFVSLDNTSFNNFEKLNKGLLSQVQKAKPKSDLGEGLLGQVSIPKDQKLWWRGVSESEAHNIQNSFGKTKPQESKVPIWNDNEVSEYLGLTDADVKHYANTNNVINVTKDKENAEGYGNALIWVKDNNVLDFDPYGAVKIDELGEYGVDWGVSFNQD